MHRVVEKYACTQWSPFLQKWPRHADVHKQETEPTRMAKFYKLYFIKLQSKDSENELQSSDLNKHLDYYLSLHICMRNHMCTRPLISMCTLIDKLLEPWFICAASRHQRRSTNKLHIKKIHPLQPPKPLI